MDIVVTGAKGFVGSVMTCRLSELGYNVYAVDNASRGLNDISQLPNVWYYEHDCLDVDFMNDLMENFSPHAVFHFAAATGDLTRPVEELEKLNVEMTENLFSMTKDYESVFVYPQTSLEIKVPDSTYVQSKSKAVDSLRTLQQKELDALWDGDEDFHRLLLFRFYNQSGSYRGFGEFRKQEVHCLPRMFRCWKTGEKFIVNGNQWGTNDGTPERDYVHILDSVDFMIHCMHRKYFHTLNYPTNDGFIEIGRGDPISVLQIINKLNLYSKEWGVEGFRDLLDYDMGPNRDFDCDTLSCGSSAFKTFRPLKNHMDILRDSFQSYEDFYHRTGMMMHMKGDK